MTALVEAFKVLRHFGDEQPVLEILQGPPFNMTSKRAHEVVRDWHKARQAVGTGGTDQAKVARCLDRMYPEAK